MLSSGESVADTSPPAETSMRRAPRQSRGQQRVTAILDAAEQLFAEAGYEASSTNELAARAGIPIGSIYQFFPNKEAILHALADRYRAGFAERYDVLLEEGLADLPLEQLVDRLIGLMVEYGGAHMAITRAVLMSGASPHLAAVSGAVQGDLLARIEALLAARAPQLPPERRAMVARSGLLAVFALLAHATSLKYSDPAMMHAMFEESKLILLAYLRAALALG